MPRRDRHGRKRIGADLLGIVLCLFVVLSMGTAVFFKSTVDKQSKAFNKDTACSKTGSTSVTAIIIDNTDNLSEIQKASLRSKLKAVIERVPKHGKLDIYPVGATTSSIVSAGFSRCNPGRGSDTNEITGNPERVEKRWSETFAGPAWEAIEIFFKPTQVSNSPLMETIQSVAISSFGEDIATSGSHKTLFVVSDMLQHSGGLSIYKGLPRQQDLFASEFFQSVAADLSGVHIEVFFLNRSNAAQKNDRAIAEFWNDIFAKQRSSDYRLTRISG